MKNSILNKLAICFLLVFWGITASAQVHVVNLTYYFPGPSGTYTAAAAVQTSNNIYNQQAIGYPSPYITNYAASPLNFNSVPIPSPMPMNYCRVVVAVYNGTDWHYGYSEWTSPDASGNIYPDLVKVQAF